MGWLLGIALTLLCALNTDGSEPEKLSIAEFLQREPSADKQYVLSGRVTTISNLEYGNLYIEDESGDVYVYGLSGSKGEAKLPFGALDVSVGDKVTISCFRARYRKTDEAKDAVLLEHIKGHRPEDEQSLANSRWLELPAMSKEQKKAFHSLQMEVEGVSTRNYSFIWDKDAMAAPWVAYPLSSWNSAQKVARTNNWGYNPLIPSDEQPMLARAYRSTDSLFYSRGHQIPSADRLGSRGANAATFYYTNMTPQRDSFNSGIWNSLEIKVRSWAGRCDTLYVVTGCVVQEGGPTALDNTGRKVAVPKAYYKALLSYKAGEPYRAAAFYLDHNGSQNGKIRPDMAISIDDLERLTGVDFFPNLKKLIGKKAAAAVEAVDPSADTWWWR